MDGTPPWRWQNVPVPEPHLGLIVAGLILHRIRPQRLLAERRARLLTGSSLITGGALLVAWATSAASNVDLAHPERLVTNGPYALSRHPMYTGWTCIYLGVALVANTRWLIILLPLLFALVHRTVLAEERHLETRLVDDYRAYQRRVRRYR